MNARWLPSSVVALLLGAGCTQAPTVAPPPRAVRAVAIAPRALEHVRTFAGTLEPRERIELRFGVPGTVRALGEVVDGDRRRALQEGDRVGRGQLLASLDEADLRLQLGVAASGVASAKAQEQAAESAQAQATIEVERARALFASGTIPKAELDRAESALAAARAAREGAVGVRLARTDQHALARGGLEDARLLSPIDGVLARRFVDVGESVSPGLAAFTVIETAQLHVAFGVPASLVSGMTLGRRLPVRVSGASAGALAGVVSKVMPEADPQLRSFTVEVTIANEDGALRPGMVASISVDDALSETLRSVPLQSVVRGVEPDSFAVWIVKDGVVERRAVTLGELAGNEIVVRDGLTDGESVVTQGAAFVRAGERVEVLP